MATVSERLAFLITADASSAIKAFENTGKAADRELGKAEAKIDKLGANMTKFGAGALAAAGVAGAALFAFADAAGDAAEATSKVNVIFGDAADTIKEFGENAARSAGLSETAALGAASTFATMGKAAGLAGEELASFSTQQVTLAADLASFSNTSPEQAIEAIGAALRGESEPIRAYGVLLNDATIKARAMTLGLYDGTGALSQQAKVLATQAEIFAQTSDAQGDFARTSDGLANQQKILAAELENLKISIGEGVLPVVTELVSGLSSAATAFGDLNPSVQSGIGTFAAYGTAALGIVGGLSLAGGQAIKMRDNFTTLGADGTRSMNKLGRAAGGVGIALAGMAVIDVAKDALNGLFDVAEKRSDTLMEAQIALGGFAEGTVDAGAAVEAFAKQTDAVDGELRGFLGLGGIVDNFFNEQISLIDGAEASLGTYTDALEDTFEQSPAQAQAIVDALREQAAGFEEGSKEAENYTKVADHLQDRLDLLTGASGAVADANLEASGAMDAAADAAGDAAEKVKTLEERFADLLGRLDDSDALLDARDQFDEVRDAAEKAAAAQEEGGAAAEAANRDLQRSINDTKREVITYADAVGGIPDESLTNIIALIDQGKLEEAEAEFERLTRTRQAIIDIIARGGGVNNYDAAGSAGTNNQPSTARAYGGPVEAGYGYKINETGTEVFVPHSDGYVYPASKVRDDMPPAGPVSTTNVTIGAIVVNGDTEQRLSEIINWYGGLAA